MTAAIQHSQSMMLMPSGVRTPATGGLALPFWFQEKTRKIRPRTQEI